jgi:hypothetical protein
MARGSDELGLLNADGVDRELLRTLSAAQSLWSYDLRLSFVL